MTALLIILVGIALLATALDWLQTLYIARHPMQYHEINPILGLHPTPRKVSVHFALCITAGLLIGAVLHLFGAVLLISFAAAGIAAMEAYWVRHNWRIGIRIFSAKF